MSLADEIDKVVQAGNCTGCGACALKNSSVSMQLSLGGFVRPDCRRNPNESPSAKTEFLQYCPGIRLRAPSATPAGARYDEIFGSYLQCYRAWAVDANTRFLGSSGGVLTALAKFAVDDGWAEAVVSARSDGASPIRTCAARVTDQEEIKSFSGSRYAPVAVLPLVDLSKNDAVVCKPCEASALVECEDASGSRRRLVMSFFCAGTPSQHATDELVRLLNLDAGKITDLRYRGEGWPGYFVAETSRGERGKLSYAESWGDHLGRALQNRCKICVDGVGEAADISAGDLWEVDDRGFPIFEDREGVSALIVRSAQGLQFVQRAAEAGYLCIEQIDIGEVRDVQVYHSVRRRAVPGRLVGRKVAGFTTPRYRGYRLIRHALADPLGTLRAGIGMYRRSRRD